MRSERANRQMVLLATKTSFSGSVPFKLRRQSSSHFFSVLMSSSLSKRLFAGMAAASLGLAVTACGGGGDSASGDFDGEIKVGILHSLSGTMAISETTLKETEELAIKEINDAGGVQIDPSI